MRLIDALQLKSGEVVFIVTKTGRLHPATVDSTPEDERMVRRYVGMDMVTAVIINKSFEVFVGESGRVPWPSLDDLIRPTSETALEFLAQEKAKALAIEAKAARVISRLPPL